MRYATMLCPVLLLALLALAPETAFCETYKWTDDKGVTHYSDSVYDVPPKFRNQVEEVDLNKPTTFPDRAKETLDNATEKIGDVTGSYIDIDNPSPAVVVGGILGLAIALWLLFALYKKFVKRPLP